MGGGYIPEERWQKLLTHLPQDDIDLDPPSAGPLYVSNKVMRVIAYIFGRYGDERREVSLSSDGEIEITGRAQIPDKLDVYDGTSANAYAADQDFAAETVIVTILAQTNPLDVKLIDSAGDDLEAFMVPADTAFSLDIRAGGFTIKSHTADAASVWQIIGSIVSD